MSHSRVKFVLGDDVRSHLVELPLSIAEPRNLLRASFPRLPASSVSLQFTDDEGESISVSLDVELEEAFRVAQSMGKTLRLMLCTRARPNAVQRPQPPPLAAAAAAATT